MFWKGIHKFSNIQVAPGGQAIGFGTYNTKGRTYFVNNITGSSSNDGLSWDRAFAEVSQAITASEAFRVLLGGTTNDYIRNTIVVQGTGTAYAALTELPNYCDIIGVGAASNGNGTGIAIIDGAGAADAITGTARGLNIYNMQFVASGSFWCCDFVQLLRSSLIDCCFQAKDTATDGGIRFKESSGGLNIKDCHWTGSGNVIHKVGFQVQGGNFDSCRIEDCIIIGTTAGVLIDNTCSTGQLGTAADNTIFRNNVIGDLGRGCATAIDDNCVVGMINYISNSIMGTAGITCVNNGAARVHGNFTANAFIAVTAS